MGWVFNLALQAVVLWLVVKCLVELFCYIIYRCTEIRLQVGSIWILSVRDVVLSVPKKGITLTIGSVGLSSSFFNAQLSKIVAIVLNDIRVESSQIVAENIGQNESLTGDASNDFKNIPQKIKKVLSLFQYVSFHGYNFSFTATSRLPDCLLHSSINEVRLNADDMVSLNGGSTLWFRCLGFKIKALQREQGSVSEGTDVKPCIAEFVLDISVMVELHDISGFSDSNHKLIRTLNIGIKKPTLTFTEVLFDKVRQIVENPNVNSPTSTSEPISSSHTANHQTSKKTDEFDSVAAQLSPFIPEETCFSLSSLDVIFWRDKNNCRSLNFTLGELSLLLRGGFFVTVAKKKVSSVETAFHDPEYPNLSAKFNLSRLSLSSSTHVQLFQLFSFELNLETMHGRKLSTGVSISGLHFCYHIEECNYWIPLVIPLTVMNQSKKNPLRSSKRKPSFTRFLPVSVCANLSVTDISLACMTVKGSAVALRCHLIKVATNLSGTELLPESPVLLQVPLPHKFSDLLNHLSTTVVVEQIHVFIGDGCPHIIRIHRWNDLMFLDKFEINLDIEPDITSLEVEVWNLRIGWVTESLKTFRDLFAAGLVSRKLSFGSLPSSPTNKPIVPVLNEPNKFLSRLSVNLKLNSLNVIICCDQNVGIVIRWDYINMVRSVNRLLVAGNGLKLALIHLQTREWNFECLDCCDMDESVILFLQGMKLKRKITNSGATSLSFEATENVSFSWNHAFHLTLKTILEELKNTMKVIRSNVVKSSSMGPELTNATPEVDITDAQPPLQISISVSGLCSLTLFVTTERRISFSTDQIMISGPVPWLSVETPEVVISMDTYDVITVSKLKAEHISKSEKMRGSDGYFDLQSQENKCIYVEMDSFEVVFPFKYDFDGLKEEAVNTVKWLKLIHDVKRKPFDVNSPLPRDINIKVVDYFRIQLTSDPFEVKLLNNYDLLRDEFKEAQVRRQKLDDVISDRILRGGPVGIGNSALTKAQVEDLYQKLNMKNASIYIKRSKQLYEQSTSTRPTGRESLLEILGMGLELMALTDRSIHGRENVVNTIKDVDPESPFPTKEPLEFSTLWCRFTHLSFKEITMKLRDYPQPLMELKEGYILGRLCGAEISPHWRSIRHCTLDLGAPWSPSIVERSMCPMKFFHDLQGEMDSIFVAQGPCWDPAISEVANAGDYISAPSVDPSPTLPFWDKMRLLFHGRLTLSSKHMKFEYLTSLDPYNQTEMLDMVWSGGSVTGSGGSGNWQHIQKHPTQTPAILDWTNGKIAIRGFLDVYVRTASKYDDCHFLHIPQHRLEVRLDWQCPGGNPNDHHLVASTAPDRVHDVHRASTHDSFRAFRSSHLKVTFDFKSVPPKMNRKTKQQATLPSASDDGPTMLLYASTMRWFKDFRQVMATVGRPIRKGKLFQNLKQRKPQLTRHISEANCNINLHKSIFKYWASYAKQYGIEMRSQAFHSSNRFELQIQPYEDDLIRRPMFSWEITNHKASLEDMWVRLCSAQAKTKSLNVEAVNRGAVDSKFFLRLQRMTYERREKDLATVSAKLKTGMKVQEDQRADSPHPDADEHVPETLDEVESATAPSELREQILRSKDPFHRLIINDLKGCWNVTNRDIIYGLHEAYQKAQTMKICLSTEALKTVKIEDKSKSNNDKNPTPSSPVKSKSSKAEAMKGKITIDATSEMFDLLDRKEIETKQWVHCDDTPEVTEQSENLQGLRLAIKLNDIVSKVCRIEFHNSQIMLKGQESPGHMIIGSAKAVIQQNMHKSVWKDQELRSKVSWHASLEGMQYFATVNPNNVSTTESDENVEWVSREVIEDPVGELNLATPSDGIAIPGSGREVGGVISDTVGVGGGVEAGESATQLQRIISRCGCQFFLVTYSNLAEVGIGRDQEIPPQVQEDLDQLYHKGISGEAVTDENTLTVCLHDLNICTNTYQFSMLLDILNNVILYVAPHNKEANAKLKKQRLFVTTSAASLAEQKKPILKLQNQVRTQSSMLRQLERELYFVHRKLDEASQDPELNQEAAKLENRVNECKRSLMADSEDLRAMILCFKENQILQERAAKAQLIAGRKKPIEAPAEVLRRTEVLIQHANWKINETDGQLSTAEVHLRKCVYKRVNKDNDSGEHDIELGHVKIENCLPAFSNTIYKDVLEPEKEVGSASSVFRFFLKERAPVGGISVKEHFEINVLPLVVHIQKEFSEKIMDFFFPQRGLKKGSFGTQASTTQGAVTQGMPSNDLNGNSEINEQEDTETDSIAGNFDDAETLSVHSEVSAPAGPPLPLPQPRRNRSRHGRDYIYTMEKRAEQNNTFLYIKIPDLEVRVSYKGEKEGRVGVGVPNIINDWKFVIPTLEYHNVTWTWLDLVKALRKDSIKKIVSQLPKHVIEMLGWKF